MFKTKDTSKYKWEVPINHSIKMDQNKKGEKESNAQIAKWLDNWFKSHLISAEVNYQQGIAHRCDSSKLIM